MIFLGPDLSDPSSHFVTNVVATIGGNDDLLVDLREKPSTEEIFERIDKHLEHANECLAVYNAFEDEDFFFAFRQTFPGIRLYTFFSDDEWRHASYDRFVALYSDFFSIPAFRNNIDRYTSYGLQNAILCPWACNPKLYRPLADCTKKYDVSFVGAAYGRRIDYVRFLLGSGVDVRLFGSGWGRYRDLRRYWGGRLSNEELVRVVNETKVNLNFLWTSRRPDLTTIKGRTMELAACRAFQVSTQSIELEHYGFRDGESIATFSTKDEMLDKVRYYLENAAEREVAAGRAFETVQQNHTWEIRLRPILKTVTTAPKPKNLPRYRILVILRREGLRNRILCKDSRMSIDVKRVGEVNEDAIHEYDGIVVLSEDTSVSNESLYVMAFAMVCDSSDVAICNFYLPREKQEKWIWIRFGEEDALRASRLARVLPSECIMVSPRIAGEWLRARRLVTTTKISVIEYPVLRVEDGLSWPRRRCLRMLFGKYNKREEFLALVRRFRILAAIGVGLDHALGRLRR